jgi:predicted histidine transporter YuiF (NhaC family)
MLITIVIGISLGFLYAQLFLYQKNNQNNNLESKSSWYSFLVKTTSQSLVRIVAILAVFALLLSWTEINFILVTILFLVVFWITILRNIQMA